MGTTAAWTCSGTSSSRLGTTVGTGDFDGDGRDDIFVGAPYDDSVMGRTYAFASTSGAPATTPSATFMGNFWDYLDCGLDGAGDVDADGYADALVGAYGYDHYTGRAFVFPGGSGGLSTTAITTLTGTTDGDDFGWAVAGAGDPPSGTVNTDDDCDPGTTELCDSGTDDTGEGEPPDKPEGCGCQASLPAPAALGWLVGLGGLLVRRRRAARRG